MIPEFFVGAMSGTSLDGVDAVLVDFGPLSARFPGGRTCAHAHQPFDPRLAEDLLALNTPGDNELHRAAVATQGLADAYGQAIEAVLSAAGLTAADVQAVGAHGQTIRHRPGEFGGTGYTLQLDPGPILSASCGIDVVSDFRSQDVALGGQGAPLVPRYHEAVFRRPDRSVAVLNLGGIGNVTGLTPGEATVGFDTGPGNVLLDMWCRRHTGRAFDDGGRWSASGRVIGGLLESLLAEPFLASPPPRSTGRDLFNGSWLDRALTRWAGDGVNPGRLPAGAAAQDVQATLAEFTARSATQALGWLQVSATRTPLAKLWVCGGGALNQDLMDRIAHCLPGTEVQSTAVAGLAPMQIEACAFAWLARSRVRGEASTLTSVTGARHAVSAGAWRSRPAGPAPQGRNPLSDREA
jgi:anhydro-N-acetylmuramic acid kinase